MVVDFGAFGGGVEVACAPGDPASGADALSGAGFGIEGTVAMPAFLCRIDGLPRAEADRCRVPPPPNAYWSYWVADRGGPWCYADVGMYGRDPERGTVDGWVFVGPGGSRAPRSSTFSAVAGGGSSGADCNGAATATTAPPTTRATTTPPAVRQAPRTGGGAAGSPGASGGSPGAGGAAVPGTGGAPGSAGSASPQATVRGTTSAPSSTSSTVAGSAQPDAPPAGDADDANDPVSAPDADKADDDSDATDRGSAASSVELARSGRSGPGSPVGTAFAVGGIVALGAGALVINRRRQAGRGDPEPPPVP